MSIKSISKSTSKITWIFGIITFLLFIGVIVIVSLSLSAKEDLPDPIDVVLLERGKNIHLKQAELVRKNMGWVRNIYVMNFDKDGLENSETAIHFVKISKDDKVNPRQILVDIDKYIDNGQRHVLFLSDQIVPLSKIHKTYLFFGKQARMFNIFQNATRREILNEYYEENEAPAAIEDLNVLKKAFTFSEYIFISLTEENTVIRNDLSRDIFINSTLQENANKQMDTLKDNPPFFATFHLSGEMSVSAKWVSQFLDKHF